MASYFLLNRNSTINFMATELKTEKKAQAVSLLCEGSSIRSIEQ